MTYVRMIEDSRGDLVEIEHYCSPQCFTEKTGKSAHGHSWPCPEQTDYDQHCPTCGDVSVRAILACPECDAEVWDGPHGHKLAKCWGCMTAFDTIED